MELLLLSVICSVSVGILFKISKLHSVELIPTLFIGYITSLFLGIVLFDVSFSYSNLDVYSIIIILVLSLLMPSLFVALRKSILINGIAKTDLVQRMSLIVPVFASFIIFNESLSYLKIAALLLGLFSVYLIMHRNEKNIHKNNSSYLVFIFIGYGIVDILFKLMSSIAFKNTLLLVFVGCIITTLFYIIFTKSKFSVKSLLIGILLGSLNFSNIYSYLQAHTKLSDAPTIVFTCMNLGVIGLGLIVGATIFKEKIRKWNIVGLICAIFAILLLSYKMLL